ncbi:MAG: hypothetical protein JO267_03435 [Alphaproteobacteria bacterium]|nr:hypothetical protein [Alphaproteobacteria bacterium]
MTFVAFRSRGAGALAAVLGALPACLVSALPALAHGFAGDRFFPATLLTDDPFVADEMSLPTVTRNPSGPDGSQQTDIGVDLAKRITPDLGITLSDHWTYLQPKGAPAVTGFGAFGAELDYQLFIDGPHEAMGLVGLHSTFAHTGRVQALGAPDFTTLSPVLDLGKGFGDLPNSVDWLRPFAITSNFSFDFPTKTESAGVPNPNVFNYGFAFEYSLEYLQHHVQDVGLSAPFDRMIPLVEASFSTPVNRGLSGTTVGTVQPGVIWAGQHIQLGAEAILPATHDTGRGFGGIVQLHLYLDDLFPNSVGRPLFQY